uniref:Uncharacterized protein n=1 Tax=Oryza brachyantha TaxID=4533 RepID=J3LNC4_ORYBR
MDRTCFSSCAKTFISSSIHPNQAKMMQLSVALLKQTPWTHELSSTPSSAATAASAPG